VTAYGVTELVVRYGATTAVDGVSFDVSPGATVALVGGDGAGKTTVLRALAGTVAAEGGVTRPRAAELGYVPADSGVYGDLTAEENLAFAGGAYGLKGRQLADRIGELLRAAGLSEARDRLAGALSGGMRRKLALAMGLVHEPRLLLLDEATTGVDPVSRADLWRGIARAAAKGTAVVFSTTYIDEAERAARVIALDAGRVLADGSAEEIIAAIRGRIAEVRERPSRGLAYRRGARFRVWVPAGRSVDAAVRPDLQDAITIAALRAQAGRRVA
jgi:ABC-2 type transport system ATP-binding protein